MKPKEYLVSIGVIESAGRGRLSREHKDICTAAIAQGIDIEGFSQNKGEKFVRPAKVKIPKADKVAQENGKVIEDIAPYRYEEWEYTAIEWFDGKKVTRSLREACSNCRVSLVQCYCAQPRIVARDGSGSVLVTIEKR